MTLHILGLFALILCFSPAYAQEEQVITRFTTAEKKIIARDLDVASFLFKLGEKIEQQAGLPLSDSAWARELQEASTELMQRAYGENPADKAIINRISKAIKWENLWKQTKHMATHVKSFGRYKGIGAAFILVVLGPSDLYFPLIATALGRPELIPIITIFPTMAVALGGQHFVKQYYTKKAIEATIGGSEAYKNFQAARAQSLQDLAIKSDDYIHPLHMVDGQLDALVVNNRTVVQKYLGMVGFKTEGLTYPNLKKFCQNQPQLAQDQVIKTLLTDSQLPEEVRVGMVFQHLQQNASEEVIESFHLEFPQSIRRFQITEGQEQLWQLYRQLSDAKTVEQLKTILAEAPETISPQTLGQLWREKLIPEWSKTMNGPSFFEFRRLVQDFDKLYGQLNNEETSQVFDQNIRELFNQYLDKSVSPKHVCNDAISPI